MTEEDAQRPAVGHDDATIVGHPDAGVVAGPSQWKKYAAAGAFVAVLAGGITYVATRDDGGDGDESIVAGAEDADDVLLGDDEVVDDPLLDDPLVGGSLGDDELGDDPLLDESLGDDPLVEDDDVIAGESGDDVLTGDEGGDDLIGGGAGDGRGTAGEDGDDLLDDLGTGDDVIVADTIGAAQPAAGLRRLCLDTRHSPVDGQDSASGIWVEGEVYGLPPGTWIWVEAPTINNGDPVGIPVAGDSFEGGLGINAYGEHPIESFGIGDENGIGPVDVADAVNDLLPGVPTVGPDEGPLFDEECFDVDVAFGGD